MLGRMNAQQRFARRLRRVESGERGEAWIVEGGEERAQTFRTIRPAGAGIVGERRGVGDEKRGRRRGPRAEGGENSQRRRERRGG